MILKFCIRCGRQIPGDSPFCRFCGAKQPDISMSNETGNGGENTVPQNQPNPGESTPTELDRQSSPQPNSAGPSDSLVVSTTEHLPDHDGQVIGTVFGTAVQTNDELGDLSSTATDRVEATTQKLIRTRSRALRKMKFQAERRGANAVVAVRCEIGALDRNVLSVIIYGTAVRFNN